MAAPQCTKCQRFKWDHTCKAFPCGVPDEIFLGDFDHRKPYPGDAGFLFEKISKRVLAGSRQDGSSIGEGGIGELTGKVVSYGNSVKQEVEENGQLSFEF